MASYILTFVQRASYSSMVMKIGGLELDTSNISQADLEKLKKMLPDLQQSGKISQLDIILEAIQYIQALHQTLGK